jgi:hypothetical protein
MEDKEPECVDAQCKTLAAAKSLAVRMAKRYPEQWGEATEEQRASNYAPWDISRRYQWDSFGWREVK